MRVMCETDYVALNNRFEKGTLDLISGIPSFFSWTHVRLD